MTNDSISNKLSELFDLFKSGALTKEEYESLKSKIINIDKVQPIIENIQEKEPEKIELKEFVIPQPEDLIGKHSVEPKELPKEDVVTPQQDDFKIKQPAVNQPVVVPVLKSKKKLGSVIIVCILLIGLIIVSTLLVKSFNDNNKLIIAKSLAEKRIQQLSADSLVKSDSISSLYHKLVNAYSTYGSNSEKSISIPDGIQENISVLDVDGNIYKAVTIGKQLWMAENLKTTKYNDGSAIPLVTDNTKWAALSTSAYCWYNNDKTANKNMCGALYNWYAVNTNELCPTGWHVPTDAEWTTLTTYLGGESIADGKLKETGTTHWTTLSKGATNESGFTALPSGSREYNGTFYGIGVYGHWWSSTEYSATYAYFRNMLNYSGVIRNRDGKQVGFSVRCLRDF
jgi:uncharacterized protein (TIGR02145 family)